MNRRGFTFTELLVGVLVGMLLIGAMASFLGSASYNFQGQKTTMKDRSHIQRTMSAMARELNFLGPSLQEGDATITYEGEDAYIISFSSDGSDLGTALTFYSTTETTKNLSANNGTAVDPTWTQVSYTLTTQNDPLTGESVNILNRNGQAFLLDVSEFRVAFGVDGDGDGAIADEEWVTTPPEDEADMDSVYGSSKIIRLTLGKNTTTSEGESFNTRLVRDVFLRNRQHY